MVQARSTVRNAPGAPKLAGLVVCPGCLRRARSGRRWQRERFSRRALPTVEPGRRRFPQRTRRRPRVRARRGCPFAVASRASRRPARLGAGSSSRSWRAIEPTRRSPFSSRGTPAACVSSTNNETKPRPRLRLWGTPEKFVRCHRASCSGTKRSPRTTTVARPPHSASSWQGSNSTGFDVPLAPGPAAQNRPATPSP